MIDVRWTGPAVLLLLAGCQGPQKEYEQYRQDMCACKDASCAEDVDEKYQAFLTRKVSFVEKHLVTKAAAAKITASIEAAQACATKLIPPAPTCGGEGGDKCPPHYICKMPPFDPDGPTDPQGKCYLVKQDVGHPPDDAH